MSIHIEAKQGEVADAVLLPGDPLRAEYIAETFLEDAVRYSRVRGMYGFTGRYKGKRISVQGTGMGIPSISIYAHELITSYGARTLLRVGTCGALQEDVRLRDVVLAMGASTDSNVNRLRFRTVDFAPLADFALLRAALQAADAHGVAARVGGVFTTDTFYEDDDTAVKRLTEHGVLAVEMETAALYTIAAREKVRALAVLTVSDHLVTGEQTTSEERQRTFTQMMQIALDAAAQFAGGA